MNFKKLLLLTTVWTLGFPLMAAQKQPSAIFIIIDREDWAAAKTAGAYSPASLKKEGFIHCSTTEQVVTVANTFFKGQENLILLKINPQKLKAKLVYERSKSLNDFFPHIHGPLNLSAVEKVFSFKPDAEGYFSLPAGSQSRTKL
jgi:uncharacterized protein (DUF952 family)